MNSDKGIKGYQEDGSSLTLDSSVIKERKHSSKSVTDGYGISVFTDEFHKRMADYEKTLDQNGIGEKIFVYKMSDGSGIHLEESMFQKPVTVTEHGYDTAKGDMAPPLYYGLFGAVLICFAVFLYRYYRKGDKMHDDYHNPENRKIQEIHGHTGE